VSVPSWVLDTNVLVSGLLQPSGPPGRLVDLVVSGGLRLTVDDRIIAEYCEVLARPKFGITRAQQEAIQALLMEQDLVGAPALAVELPDPDDLPFLEAAALANDKILVTGNPKHFPASQRHGVRLLSPREAWTRCVG